MQKYIHLCMLARFFLEKSHNQISLRKRCFYGVSRSFARASIKITNVCLVYHGFFFFFGGGGGAEKVRLFVEGFIAYVCRVRTDWIPGRIPLRTCDMSFPPRGPCTDIDPSSGCTLCSYSHSCCSHKPHIYSYNLLLKYGYCLKYRVLLSFFF